MEWQTDGETTFTLLRLLWCQKHWFHWFPLTNFAFFIELLDMSSAWQSYPFNIIFNLCEFVQILQQNIFLVDKFNHLYDVMSAGSIFGLIILLTLVGNALVLLALVTTKTLQQPWNFFLASLACADLGVGQTLTMARIHVTSMMIKQIKRKDQQDDK